MTKALTKEKKFFRGSITGDLDKVFLANDVRIAVEGFLKEWEDFDRVSPDDSLWYGVVKKQIEKWFSGVIEK